MADDNMDETSCQNQGFGINNNAKKARPKSPGKPIKFKSPKKAAKMKSGSSRSASPRTSKKGGRPKKAGKPGTKNKQTKTKAKKKRKDKTVTSSFESNPVKQNDDTTTETATNNEGDPKVENTEALPETDGDSEQGDNEERPKTIEGKKKKKKASKKKSKKKLAESDAESNVIGEHVPGGQYGEYGYHDNAYYHDSNSFDYDHSYDGYPNVDAAYDGQYHGPEYFGNDSSEHPQYHLPESYGNGASEHPQYHGPEYFGHDANGYHDNSIYGYDGTYDGTTYNGTIHENTYGYDGTYDGTAYHGTTHDNTYGYDGTYGSTTHDSSYGYGDGTYDSTSYDGTTADETYDTDTTGGDVSAYSEYETEDSEGVGSIRDASNHPTGHAEETVQPSSFFMRPGSIDMKNMLAAVGTGNQQDVSNSSSVEDLVSESTGPVIKLSKKPAHEKRQRTPSDDINEAKQLAEISKLHNRMLEMQQKNFDLTQAVAQSGAATAAAVRALLDSKDKLYVPDLFDHGLGDPTLPGSATPVYIKTVFLKLVAIDTLAQNFEAEVYIEARWLEWKFQGLSMGALSQIEFSECWDPQLKILNVAGELEMDETSMVLRYEPDSNAPVLVYMWHVKGTFREKMELQHFPFDVQEMSIVLSSDLPASHVELLEDTGHDSSVNKGALQGCEEWKSYRHVEFVRDVTTRELESTSKHPVLVVSAHVKRRLGTYFWNVALIVLLILFLTFTLLAIDPAGNDRLSVIMTLFLTATAFKLVVNSSLPTISYLTYLDIYVVFAMVYLFLQGAESAIILHLSKFRGKKEVRYYDKIGQSCLIAFLILFHLILVIYIQWTVLGRRRQMTKLDYDFEMTRAKRKKERLEREEAHAIAEKAHLDLTVI